MRKYSSSTSIPQGIYVPLASLLSSNYPAIHHRTLCPSSSLPLSLPSTRVYLLSTPAFLSTYTRSSRIPMNKSIMQRNNRLPIRYPSSTPTNSLRHYSPTIIQYAPKKKSTSTSSSPSSSTTSSTVEEQPSKTVTTSPNPKTVHTAPASSPSPPTDSSIEAMYQKKTPIEHVLLRPGMYIGSTEIQRNDQWIYDPTLQRMVKHTQLTYSPGLLKLFDEILVNACDNKQRDTNMKELQVWIDKSNGGSSGGTATKSTSPRKGKLPSSPTIPTKNTIDLSLSSYPRISIYNDGKGIPVVVHSKEKVYVPDLIFGQLLTGSNFGEKKPTASTTVSSPSTTVVSSSANSSTTMTGSTVSGTATASSSMGGQHGYGAKLTNIFSKQFTVETADTQRRVLYSQTWTDNMHNRQEPILSKLSDTSIQKDFTRVTFIPDLSRFNTSLPGTLDEGTYALMLRRTVDAAGTIGSNVTVTLNGQSLPVTSFEDYVRLYLPLPQSSSPNSTTVEANGTKISAKTSTDTLSIVCTPNEAAVKLSSLYYFRYNAWLEVAVSPCNFRIQSSSSSVSAKVSSSLSSSSSSSPTLHTWSTDELDMYNTPSTVSFVNGINTSRGGTHVAIVNEILARQLAEFVMVRVRKYNTSTASTEDTKIDPANVTPALVKQHMRTFISLRMDHPSFDSQSKEQLVSSTESVLQTIVDDSSSKIFEFPDKFIKQIAEDSGIIPAIIATLQAKVGADLVRTLRKVTRNTDAKIRAIPKLEDANYAGTKRSHECTLILTEGDSAKALAVAGLSVVERDYYGVFPLRGKPLNVRDVSYKTALANTEVAALVTILGLDFQKTYANMVPEDRGLRYGKVMIMTDQDVDGSHIKGLLVNLFHTFWPYLLQNKETTVPFLEQFITPVMKARQGKVVREFFSVRTFDDWRNGLSVTVPVINYDEIENSMLGKGKKTKKKGITETNVTVTTVDTVKETSAAPPVSSTLPTSVQTPPGEALQGKWSIKYYKGLGTSTSVEGRAYFKALERHRRSFIYTGPDDNEAIIMAFDKNRTDDRKVWMAASSTYALSSSSTTTPLENSSEKKSKSKSKDKDSTVTTVLSPSSSTSAFLEVNGISFTKFIHHELIEFALADLQRSVPSVLDGLKPSQRKILYACFRRISSSKGSLLGNHMQSTSTNGVTTATEDTENIESETSTSSTTSSTTDLLLPSKLSSTSIPVLPSPSMLGNEIKVAQLAGYVAEHTAYHHGEVSLTNTIVGMAQDFVGSNNINLLQPLGQFGTRLAGGKDAASARYIFTKVAPLTRLLFPAMDDDLLCQKDDDGQLVEPVNYLPIIPLVLVNGALGIGTGWSTSVPMYNPLDITKAVDTCLRNGTLDKIQKIQHKAATSKSKSNVSRTVTTDTIPPAFPLVPWWKGFNGQIVSHTVKGAQNYVIYGKLNIDESSKDNRLVIRITELPIGKWIEDYKTFLQENITNGYVKAFKEYHTEMKADFLVTLSDEGIKELQSRVKKSSANGSDEEGFVYSSSDESDNESTAKKRKRSKKSKTSKRFNTFANYGFDESTVYRFFKLTTPLSMNNMHLFDNTGRIQRFTTPWDIVYNWLPVRAVGYDARKLKLEGSLASTYMRASVKARFLHDVIDGKLKVSGRKRQDIILDLYRNHYPLMDRGITTSPSPTPASSSDEPSMVPFLTTDSHYKYLFNHDLLVKYAKLTHQEKEYHHRQLHNTGSAPIASPASTSVRPTEPLPSKAYDYLLAMPLWQLTAESLTKAVKSANEAQQLLQQIHSTSALDMWKNDLANLSLVLQQDSLYYGKQ